MRPDGRGQKIGGIREAGANCEAEARHIRPQSAKVKEGRLVGGRFGEAAHPKVL